MEFKEKLKKLRKEKRFSQEQLAEKIYVSRQAVSKWESGLALPDIENIVNISKIFGVSIDKLIKDDSQECVQKEEKKVEVENEAIVEFLIKAKKETYASGKGKVKSSRPNSYDFEYSQDRYRYIDTYLGSEKFSGQEAVWLDESPLWAMNYTGRVTDEGFSGSFLKEALMAVGKDYPYRGPLVYIQGDYTYHLVINGEFEWFNGREEIFFSGKKVYECLIHGGIVK